jgi:hypothetical protein
MFFTELLNCGTAGVRAPAKSFNCYQLSMRQKPTDTHIEWLRHPSIRCNSTLMGRTHPLSAVSPTSLKKLQKCGTARKIENRFTLRRAGGNAVLLCASAFWRRKDKLSSARVRTAPKGAKAPMPFSRLTQAAVQDASSDATAAA